MRSKRCHMSSVVTYDAGSQAPKVKGTNQTLEQMACESLLG